MALQMLTPDEDGPAFGTHKTHSGRDASELRFEGCDEVQGSECLEIKDIMMRVDVAWSTPGYHAQPRILVALVSLMRDGLSPDD
ncbi:hypothetical protein Ddc_22359 [Ditylenchus destructor]|nr:hypothetical protein Ddc_22359 [Ditylenchus destructor]